MIICDIKAAVMTALKEDDEKFTCKSEFRIFVTYDDDIKNG